MEKTQLIDFFAKFWKINRSKIDNSLRIDSQTLEGYSSIRFFQFIAAIESNFDVKIGNLDGIFNFGDLFDNLK